MSSKQQEIYNEMIAQKERNEALKEANNTSKTSVINNIFFAVSLAINSLLELFEFHKAEVSKLSYESERRTSKWYQSLALKFQYGHQLVEGKDYFDNTNKTPQEIEESKLVKFAVAVQEKDKSTIYIKIANANKQPLTNEQLQAFSEYMERVADWGVHLTIINEVPDKLKLTIDYWYDATLINSSGQSLTGGNEPVKDKVKDFLTTLNFNQQYADMNLIDELQRLPSAKVVEIKESFYKYKTLNWQRINGRYIPYAGHLAIEDIDLQINYIKG